MFLLSRNEHHIYLDFGGYYTKVAYLTKQGSNLKVQKCVLEPTPDECLSEEAPTDPLRIKEFLFKTLKQFTPSVRKEAEYHLISPDPHTLIKKLHLPKPLPKDLNQQMGFEAAQYAPYPIEDAVVDFTRVDDDPFFRNTLDEKEAQMLLTITKNTSIRPWITLFEEMDTPLSSVVPGSVGLLNFGLHLLRSHQAHDQLALVHIGDRSTLMLYISQDLIRFYYEPCGLLDCITQATKQCHLTLQEGRYFATHLSQKDIPELFVSCFYNGLSRFTEDITARLLKLCPQQEDKKTRVLVSGGACCVSELTQLVGRAPELTVDLLTPESYTSHLTFATPGIQNTVFTFFPSLLGLTGKTTS